MILSRFSSSSLASLENSEKMTMKTDLTALLRHRKERMSDKDADQLLEYWEEDVISMDCFVYNDQRKNGGFVTLSESEIGE